MAKAKKKEKPLAAFKCVLPGKTQVLASLWSDEGWLFEFVKYEGEKKVKTYFRLTGPAGWAMVNCMKLCWNKVHGIQETI